MRRLALVLAVLAALTAAGVASAAEPCPGGMRCGTLEVPLDRAGGLPGTLDLRFATRGRARGGTVLALTGGPGQAGVLFGPTFRATLAPLVRSRRLVVLDQRGTGPGALSCPDLQRQDGLDSARPSLVERCARRIGPARQAFATADVVADLEALRERLGVRRWTIAGVSYGTYVALQYARAHPDRVARLVLDSPVPGVRPEPHLLSTYTQAARVLREACAQGVCPGLGGDPAPLLGAVAARAEAGTVRGRLPDARGRRRAARLAGSERLLLALLASDLNPFLASLVPGALIAARDGDPLPLLRVARLAEGGRTPRTELSTGLNAVTACADSDLPYTFAQPEGDRAAAFLQATAGLDAGPFGLAALRPVSVAEDCLRWPQGDVFTPPSAAPVPDVPALVLSGRGDLRTPVPDAREVARSLPRAQLVLLRGSGHDVLGSDGSGCTATALERFAAGRRVGTPCRGIDVGVEPVQAPAARLAALRPVGASGTRGRVVAAVGETVLDAASVALSQLLSGIRTRAAGGLRSGRMAFDEAGERLRLVGYEAVGGVRVSGRLDLTAQDVLGILRVRARGASGRLVAYADGSLRGRLGGRRVSTARAAAATYSSSSSAARCAAAMAPPSTSPITRAKAIAATGRSAPKVTVPSASRKPTMARATAASGRCR